MCTIFSIRLLLIWWILANKRLTVHINNVIPTLFFKKTYHFENMCNENVDKNTGSIFFVYNSSFVLMQISLVIVFLGSVIIMI